MEKNSFLVVRHSYDDHSYIDGKNDTGLTLKGIEIAKNACKEILPQIGDGKVIIRHSTKKRAKETAEILAEYLSKNNIPSECVMDVGLTELFQGTFDFFDMEHQERVDFLQSCWDDFETCRMQGDLTHCFGQNKNRRIILRPGENHAQWSVRIATGMLHIIGDLEQSAQSINITHRGAIFEIEKIVEMINNNIPFDDVERYKTIWMPYCQNKQLHINDLEQAKVLTKKYISQRRKYENNN